MIFFTQPHFFDYRRLLPIRAYILWRYRITREMSTVAIQVNITCLLRLVLFRNRKQRMNSDLWPSSALHTLAVSDNISQKSIFIDNNQTVIPESNHHHRL